MLHFDITDTFWIKEILNNCFSTSSNKYLLVKNMKNLMSTFKITWEFQHEFK